MPQDPVLEKLLQQAQQALEAGYPAADVNARIYKLTNGRIADMAALAAAVGSRPTAQPPSIGPAQPVGTSNAEPGSPADVQYRVDIGERLADQAMSPGNLGRAALKGVTMGAAPKLLPELYESYPEGNLGLAATELTGLLGASVLGAGAGSAALGRIPALASDATRTPGVMRGLLRAATAEGAVGAAAGAGYSEPGKELRGAAVGGSLGALLSPMSVGATRIGAGLHGSTARRAAGRELLEDVEALGLSVDEVPSLLSRPGAVGADLGPTTAVRGGRAMAIVPERADELSVALRRRASAESRRLGDELAQSTGVPAIGDRLPEDELADLAAQRRGTTQRYYTAIEQKYPVIRSDELSDILQHPDVSPLWSRVRPRGGKDTPTISHYQALRDLMFGEASKLEAASNNAGARLLRDKASEVLAAVERVAPEFGPANTAWRLRSGPVNGFESGLEVVRRKMPAERVRREMDRVVRESSGTVTIDGEDIVGDPAAARDAFRQGMAWQLIMDMRSPSAGPSRWRSALADEPRLRVLFDSDAAMESFLDEIAPTVARLRSARMGVAGAGSSSRGPDALYDFTMSLTGGLRGGTESGTANFLQRMVSRLEQRMLRSRAQIQRPLLMEQGKVDELVKMLADARDYRKRSALVSRLGEVYAPAAIGGLLGRSDLVGSQ